MTSPPVPRRNGAPGDPVFLRRVLSALVLAPAALLLVWAGGTPFSIFIAAFAAAMAWEWVRMSDKTAPPRAFAIATGTAVGAALLAGQAHPGWTAAWIAGGAVFAGLDRRRRGRAYDAVAGVAYIALAAAVLVSLREGEQGGLAAVLFLLAVVWAADTFAYLAGSWIGGAEASACRQPQQDLGRPCRRARLRHRGGSGRGAAAGL